MYLRKGAEPYLIYLTLFVAVLGPVFEEIFFRGFAYPPFRQRFGVRWAMVGVSAIFALFHMNAILFIPIFLLGVFLVTLYEKTGSLVPSITAHICHNLIMVGLTLGFKNLSN
jgi:membrane protease YdiL (CAAX protease family)